MKKKLSLFLVVAALLPFHGEAEDYRRLSEAADGGVTASSETAIVDTQTGMVAGYHENDVYIYKGIPYAKARRFMPPEPMAKWDGVRSSRAYGPTCPQAKRQGWQSDEHAFAFNWDDGHADESCLCLNIWTSGVKDGKKLKWMILKILRKIK